MLRNSKFHVSILCTFVFLTVGDGLEQCQKLEASLFPNCIKAGIDATIRLPSNKSKELVFKSNLTQQTIHRLRRCSPYIEFLVCSVSTPQCIEGIESPVLPCRRVCTDVLRGCDVQRVRHGDVEWLKGLCKLLPDEEPSPGKCIEPKNFEPQHKKVPFQQTCSKLFLPQCVGFGYNYTTKNFIEQLWLSQHFDSILNDTRSNYTACEAVLRELLCTELVPACFKGNQTEPAIYTVCRSKCQALWNNCPVVFEKQFGIFEDCTMAAEEETEFEGFCKVTEWPGTSRWNKAEDPHILVLTTNREGGSRISVGALIICVVVIIVLVLLAFGVYNVFKRKRIFRIQGYYRHGENEEEEEMTIVVPA